MYKKLILEYLENEPNSIEFFLNDCMDLLHGLAQEKKIEFDGYFQERWEDSAATIVDFDEDYFEDRCRKNLYVFLSALCDDEIFELLEFSYKTCDEKPLTKLDIEQEVRKLIKNGTRF